MVKNPNWREADQLATYKRGGEFNSSLVGAKLEPASVALKTHLTWQVGKKSIRKLELRTGLLTQMMTVLLATLLSRW